MTTIDFEFAFKTLWGLGTAAGWFWVNGISARLKDADRRAENLRERLHQVEINYRTNKAASDDLVVIAEGMRRLESKLDKLNDKLDRKADK